MAGQEVPLTGDFVIGRGEQGAGNLAGDTEISRRHARFRRLDNGQIMVEDLGSTNGTLVNGVRITSPHVLSPGDQITLGKTTLRLADAAQPAAAAAPAASPQPAVAQPAAAAPAVGVGPLPPIGRPPTATVDRGSHRGRGVWLALLGLLLLGAGVAAGLLINKDSGKTTTVSQAGGGGGGVVPPTGSPGSGSNACVSDNTGGKGSGHFRFLRSACENATHTVATLPLHRGTSNGQTVWYVMMDESNKADAARNGLNYSPKLANAANSTGVMPVTVSNGVVNFPATPNFKGQRIVTPGSPNAFPPSQAAPPANANPPYSPLIKMPDGTVINAPQVANSTGQGNKVIKLDTAGGKVQYQETEGRYEDKMVHYASFDSSSPIAAAIEDMTYAPALGGIPAAGKDSLTNSAREELVAFVNGPTGTTNPSRQGVNSTILDKLDPHNILKEVPMLPFHPNVGAPEYTPGWDVHLAEWTPAAVTSGARVKLQSTDEVALRVMMKDVTGPGGKPFGASGFVVNCPLISIEIP
jgi:hypothetical protein